MTALIFSSGWASAIDTASKIADTSTSFCMRFDFTFVPPFCFDPTPDHIMLEKLTAWGAASMLTPVRLPLDELNLLRSSFCRQGARRELCEASARVLQMQGALRPVPLPCAPPSVRRFEFHSEHASIHFSRPRQESS